MNVKIKRLLLGMQQCELAKLAGISSPTLVEIEKGNIDSVRFGILRKISEVLDCSFEDLFIKKAGDL